MHICDAICTNVCQGQMTLLREPHYSFFFVGDGAQYPMMLVITGKYTPGSPRRVASIPMENNITDADIATCISNSVNSQSKFTFFSIGCGMTTRGLEGVGFTFIV